MVSKVYYEVRMTCVLYTATISNVNSVMFVDRNKRDGKFLSPVMLTINISSTLFTSCFLLIKMEANPEEVAQHQHC